MPDEDAFHVALIGHGIKSGIRQPPPGTHSAVVGLSLRINNGFIEMEAEVCVIALVEFIRFAAVRTGHDAPSPGNPPGLFQKKSKIRPLLRHEAVRIGTCIRPLVQTAPHDQVEVESIQLPPLPKIGFRQALSCSRIPVHIRLQLLRPAAHKLSHQNTELLLAKVSLPVRDLRPEGVSMPLHMACQPLCHLLEAQQILLVISPVSLQYSHPFLTSPLLKSGI